MKTLLIKTVREYLLCLRDIEYGNFEKDFDRVDLHKKIARLLAVTQESISGVLSEIDKTITEDPSLFNSEIVANLLMDMKGKGFFEIAK